MKKRLFIVLFCISVVYTLAFEESPSRSHQVHISQKKSAHRPLQEGLIEQSSLSTHKESTISKRIPASVFDDVDFQRFKQISEFDPNSESNLEQYNEFGLIFEKQVIENEKDFVHTVFRECFREEMVLSKFKAAFIFEVVFANIRDPEGLVQLFSTYLEEFDSLSDYPPNVYVFADVLAFHVNEWKMDKIPENVDMLLKNI